MSERAATLALGGGGARGIAHLGAIEEVLRAGWKVERVVGVSIGSLAGALFTFDPEIDIIQRRAVEYLSSPTFLQRQEDLLHTAPKEEDTSPGGGLFSWYNNVVDFLKAHHVLTRAVTRRSLLPGALLEDVVSELLPDADIADAEIPFGVSAVDLITGEFVLLERGPLRKAVRASASLPGIFPPVELDGRLLCDSGVLVSLPSRVARKHDPETVIAVDVGSPLKRLENCGTALDVLMRIIEVGEATFHQELSAGADLIIAPPVADIHWADFSQAESLIEIGRRAARDALQQFHPRNHWLKRIMGTGSNPT